MVDIRGRHRDNRDQSRVLKLGRVVAILGIPLLLIGPMIAGPSGGLLLFVAGIGELAYGSLLLLDVDGSALEMSQLFEERIGRRIPGAKADEGPIGRTIGRFMGGVWALLGMAVTAFSLLMLVGLIRPA